MVLDELETFIYTLRRRGLSHFLRKVAHARNATGVFHWMSPGISPKGRHWNDLSPSPKNTPANPVLALRGLFAPASVVMGLNEDRPGLSKRMSLLLGKPFLPLRSHSSSHAHGQSTRISPSTIFRRRRVPIARFVADLGCLWWIISDSSDRSVLLLPCLAPEYGQSVDCVFSKLLA